MPQDSTAPATREKLPIDGARYRCGYGTIIGPPWRCDNDAKEALTHEALVSFTDRAMHKNEVIHGRAMCELHLSTIEGKLAPS